MSTSEKVTLIIGASLNSDRYSNKAFHRLKAANHKVYNIGFREGVLEDLKIYKEHQLDWSTIDTVTLYLGPARQEPYYDYLLKLKELL